VEGSHLALITGTSVVVTTGGGVTDGRRLAAEATVTAAKERRRMNAHGLRVLLLMGGSCHSALRNQFF
jgi:hypothetical protein